MSLNRNLRSKVSWLSANCIPIIAILLIFFGTRGIFSSTENFNGGLLVTHIIPDSDLNDKIIPGDFILAVEGKPVTAGSEVKEILKDIAPGESVQVLTSRGLFGVKTKESNGRTFLGFHYIFHTKRVKEGFNAIKWVYTIIAGLMVLFFDTLISKMKRIKEKAKKITWVDYTESVLYTFYLMSFAISAILFFFLFSPCVFSVLKLKTYYIFPLFALSILYFLHKLFLINRKTFSKYFGNIKKGTGIYLCCSVLVLLGIKIVISDPIIFPGVSAGSLSYQREMILLTVPLIFTLVSVFSIVDAFYNNKTSGIYLALFMILLFGASATIGGIISPASHFFASNNISITSLIGMITSYMVFAVLVEIFFTTFRLSLERKYISDLRSLRADIKTRPIPKELRKNGESILQISQALEFSIKNKNIDVLSHHFVSVLDTIDAYFRGSAAFMSLQQMAIDLKKSRR